MTCDCAEYEFSVTTPNVSNAGTPKVRKRSSSDEVSCDANVGLVNSLDE